ncbi:MAG: hypothetical protein JNJ57_03730 [Saprospiraceae bacterium]|nr:hypothetical protein [Saprospiraceae bacterium]
MKHLILLIVPIFGFACSLKAQIIVSPLKADSSDFPKTYQWNLWKQDSLHAVPFEARTNSLIRLHRTLLPPYYDLKKEIKKSFSEEQFRLLTTLDSAYSAQLEEIKLRMLGKSSELNQNLPILTYLEILIIYETLEVYPDVYAVMVKKVYPASGYKHWSGTIDWEQSITNRVYETGESIFKRYQQPYADFSRSLALNFQSKDYMLINQGALDETDREKFNRVSFLLWCFR